MHYNNLHKEAQRLGVCDKMTGVEKDSELIELFFSPQGIEFCTSRNFPSVEQFRAFDAEMLQRGGIYVDSSDVEIHNAAATALIGKTCARMVFDDPTKRHLVVLMHGATAEIIATNWAVVFVFGSKNYMATITNNGKVL